MAIPKFFVIRRIISEVKLPVFTLLGLVSLGTYLFHYYEKPYYDSINEEFTYLTAFYYILVTITTIGYGDISPKTKEGIIVALSIIVFGLALLSFSINSISQRISFWEKSAFKL